MAANNLTWRPLLPVFLPFCVNFKTLERLCHAFALGCMDSQKGLEIMIECHSIIIKANPLQP